MKNLTKVEFQKKFRFIIMIAAVAIFIGLVLPAYWNYSKTEGYGITQKAIMMWSVVFGIGKAPVGGYFSLSWIGLIPFVLSFIIVVLWFARTFLSVEVSDNGRENGIFALDLTNFVLSIIMLLMFIFLPISILSLPKNSNAYLLASKFGWSMGYIYLYIVCAIMVISSIFVLYSDVIVKKINKKRKNNS